MRILGLDFGDKTVGVALSDPLGITAQRLDTIRRKSPGKLRRTLSAIDEYISKYEVGLVILGYPKNMDNTDGERALKTREFKEALERRSGVDVILWDERLTTAQARRVLMDGNVRTASQKQHLDEMAAVILLQNYLESRRFAGMEKLEFTLNNNEKAFFYVEEQAKIGGIDYLLVSDSQDDEAEALILKDVSSDDDDEAVYVIVEDENELDAVMHIFAEMLDDVTIQY